MEEFFPEWDLLQGTEDGKHYTGLSVGNSNSDLLDDQFDLELEDILKDYNAFSGYEDKEQEGAGKADEPAPHVESAETQITPEQRRPASKRKARQKQPSVSSHVGAVRELGSLVEELSEELEILLFYQRKCYIKNLRNCNYLRVVGFPLSIEEAMSDLKGKVKAPFISVPTELGALASPHADCAQSALPFWKDDLHEWIQSDMKKLDVCVYQGYYRRQFFFIDGKFHFIFMQMGIEPHDLQPVQNNLRRLGDDLWNVMKYEHFSELRRTRYFSVLNKYLQNELDMFNYIVKDYELAKKPILPYELKRRECQTTVTLTLEQILAWKQHETRQIFDMIYHREGSVDIDQVDWLLVQKEMGLFLQKDFKWDNLKRFYAFSRSTKFNHSAITRSELLAIKKMAKKEGSSSIDWTKLSKQLCTNRSPVRVFQTFKKFISRRVYPNNLLSNYDDRLNAFLHVKNYLGHLPRIVFRLSEKFGSIAFKEFLSLWKELNPKYLYSSFQPVEDAALIVGLEIFRDRLLNGEFFPMLQNTLPWRHSHVWRRRVQSLLSPCNRDEDRLLLYAVDRYGLSWPGLQKLFPNRLLPAVQARYILLEKKIQYTTLSVYHSIYFTCSSKLKLNRLQTVLNILREISNEEILSTLTDNEASSTSSPNVANYKGLEPGNMSETLSHNKLTQNPLLPGSFPNDFESLPYSIDNCGVLEVQFLNEVLNSECEASAKPPHLPQVLIYKWKTLSEKDITNYLKTFDRGILIAAATRLAYFLDSLQRVKTINNNNDLIAGCNRRQFFPENPVSVASALHLRRVRLKPITKRLWETLSPFEKTVCKAYQAFWVGHRTKVGAIRKSIPTALSLSFLPCVRNIIESPKQLAHEPLPLALSLAPCPPQILLNRGSQIQEEETVEGDQQRSPVKLERVEPTHAMTEAHNSLCRKIWNNDTETRRPRVLKTQKKQRKKILLAAAARSRWQKQKEREKLEAEDGQSSSTSTKIPRREPWFVSLLKKLNNKEDGTELGFGYESVMNEDYMNSLNRNEALAVLHDHSYFSGCITRVQKVVDDIMQTSLMEDNSDSAKENAEAQSSMANDESLESLYLT